MMQVMQSASTDLEAVIFDWAGVFCSPGEPFAHPIFSESGLSLAQLESEMNLDYMKVYRGEISMQEFWESVLTHFSLTSVSPEDLDKAYRNSYTLYPNMLTFARSLRPHLKTALLSNLTGSMMEEILSRHAISSHFDFVLFSNEIGYMKPESESFARALEKLGTNAKTTLFVDDTLQNISAAKALGFRTFHFISPEESLSELVSRTSSRTNNRTLK